MTDWKDRIPPMVREAIDRYVETGIEPGDFTMAVLTNHFVDAVCRADPDSTAALREIAHYVYNEIPADAWGSREKVCAWIKSKREKTEA